MINYRTINIKSISNLQDKSVDLNIISNKNTNDVNAIFNTVNENFSKEFKNYLCKFLNHDVKVKLYETNIISYLNFKESFCSQYIFYNFDTNLPISIVSFAFKLDFISIIIDILFGGIGKAEKINQSNNALSEKYITNYILNLIKDSYNNTWLNSYNIKLKFVNSYNHDSFFFLKENTKIICSSFIVDINKEINTKFLIIFPLKLKNFDSFLENRIEEKNYKNKIWKENILKRISNLRLEIIARFDDIKINLLKLLSLKKGDVINIPYSNNLTAYINDLPIFFCSYGCVKGYFALKINHFIDQEINNLIKEDH